VDEVSSDYSINGACQSRPQIGPAGREVTIVDGGMWVLGGCSDAVDHAAPMGSGGTLLRHQPGLNTRVLDWRALMGLNRTKRSGLLIRGFGVRGKRRDEPVRR
jgi:hypothetical protein